MTNLTPTAERLRSFIERIESAEEQQAELAKDIKEIKADAKAEGFDVKTITTIVRLRKRDPHDRAQEKAMLEQYLSALNMEA